MSLPARVLQPATRAIGMGMFFTMYYAAMMLGPVIGGAYAKWSGTAAAAFDFGAIVRSACVSRCCWGFNRIRHISPPRPLAARMPTLHATVDNTSLTLSAVGSGDSEWAVVGWRRCRLRKRNHPVSRLPRSDDASSG